MDEEPRRCRVARDNDVHHDSGSEVDHSRSATNPATGVYYSLFLPTVHDRSALSLPTSNLQSSPLVAPSCGSLTRTTLAPNDDAYCFDSVRPSPNSGYKVRRRFLQQLSSRSSTGVTVGTTSTDESTPMSSSTDEADDDQDDENVLCSSPFSLSPKNDRSSSPTNITTTATTICRRRGRSPSVPHNDRQNHSSGSVSHESENECLDFTSSFSLLLSIDCIVGISWGQRNYAHCESSLLGGRGADYPSIDAPSSESAPWHPRGRDLAANIHRSYFFLSYLPFTYTES
jgi:hypothetical protein